jgi:hypothetical protein
VTNLYKISEFSGFITNEEICKALSGAQANMANASLNMSYNELYQLTTNKCSPSDKKGVYCLFLYVYALSSFPTNGESEYSFLTEDQLAGLLTNVEQISKSCCCE